jgi:CHAD domain-containing protein
MREFESKHVLRTNASRTRLAGSLFRKVCGSKNGPAAPPVTGARQPLELFEICRVGLWTMSTVLPSDSVVQVPDSAGFPVCQAVV